jgi:hypothetical protein
MEGCRSGLSGLPRKLLNPGRVREFESHTFLKQKYHPIYGKISTNSSNTLRKRTFFPVECKFQYCLHITVRSQSINQFITRKRCRYAVDTVSVIGEVRIHRKLVRKLRTRQFATGFKSTICPTPKSPVNSWSLIPRRRI